MMLHDYIMSQHIKRDIYITEAGAHVHRHKGLHSTAGRVSLYIRQLYCTWSIRNMSRRCFCLFCSCQQNYRHGISDRWLWLTLPAVQCIFGGNVQDTLNFYLDDKLYLMWVFANEATLINVLGSCFRWVGSTDTTCTEPAVFFTLVSFSVLHLLSLLPPIFLTSLVPGCKDAQKNQRLFLKKGITATKRVHSVLRKITLP